MRFILAPLCVLIVGVLVCAPAANAQALRVDQANLTGFWDGDADGKKEWGAVNLKRIDADYIGTYRDTYNGDFGNMSFKRVGDRKYLGLWWECSLERYGSFELQASEDGKTLSVAWKTLDDGKVGPKRSLRSVWKRSVK